MQTDNFSYVVPVDYRLHTPEKPFCYDQSCGCHEDELLIGVVITFIADGLMTADEANDFLRGRGI
jgi:hypothetical protein